MGSESGLSSILFQALGSMTLLPLLACLLVLGPLAIYPIARWRAHRDPAADSQLGLKVALGYFGLLGFQLALLGLALVLYALMSKQASGERGALCRSGFGLLVPGGIVLAAHLGLLRRTNDAAFPGVRRLFLGYNLIATGLLGCGALVLAFEALFARSGLGEAGRFAAAAVIVYGGAWATCGYHFGRTVLAAPAPPPPDVPPPAPAPPPAGPSLPSLGGGAYPPLDRR